MWWQIPIGVLAALAAVWLIVGVALWLAKPGEVSVKAMARLLPDLLVLLKRLALDPQMPRAIRIALALLLAFTLSPIDVIPDFIPVIGFADDVILVALVLRWITRRAAADALTRHWPGTPEGLMAVRHVCGLEQPG